MNTEKPAGSVGAGHEPPASLLPGAAGRPLTQVEQLAAAFDAGERLTVATALGKYGIYALSQRCGDLFRSGYPVESRTVETPTGKHVSEYFRGGIAHG